MSKLTGVVSGRSEREGRNKKNGKEWKVINIKLGDDWFGGYVDRVPTILDVEEGDTVAIEWESNGAYKNYTSVDIIAKGSKVTAPNGEQKPASVVDREWHISLGAGINQAVTVVNNMLEHEVISLPAAKKAKYDAYLEYIKEVALDLAKFNFFSQVPEMEDDDDEGSPFDVDNNEEDKGTYSE